MTTKFSIRSVSASGLGSIIARVQRPEIGLDLKLSTKLSANKKRFELAKTNEVVRDNYKKADKALWDKLDDIKAALENYCIRLDASSLATDIKRKEVSDKARELINNIVYREAIEAEAEKAAEEARKVEEAHKAEEAKKAQAAAEARKNDFMDYYRAFVDSCKKVAGYHRGHIKTLNKEDKIYSIGKDKGKLISERTAMNYSQGYNWLLEYQQVKLNGQGISFDDIDQAFFDDYQAYMEERELKAGQYKGERGCKHNTVAMRLAELKSLLKRAARDKKPVRQDLDKIEIANDVEVDSIALTRPELDAIMAVDLSDLPACYEQARDIFMVGVWTAQRVSDYNDIKPEDILQRKHWVVVEENGEKVAREKIINYITIRQKKTGVRVTIPVNTQLKAILDKYSNNLPRLWPQHINDYMKVICRKAGLTQKELIVTRRGGKEIEQYVERCELVHTHTARKTAATLMYNEGASINDIMTATGHKNLDTLKKYIKATGEDVACRLADNCAFFR